MFNLTTGKSPFFYCENDHDTNMTNTIGLGQNARTFLLETPTNIFISRRGTLRVYPIHTVHTVHIQGF